MARLLIGRVYRPHGTGGAFKVIPESDDPARLATLRTLYVGATAEAARALGVRSCRLMPTKQGATLLVEADGVDTPEAAEALRGLNVYAPEADLPLYDGEYFLHDLIGLTAVDAEGKVLGEVVEVRDGPQYAFLEIQQPSGRRVLVPDVPAFVERYDFAARTALVVPVEGLFDA